MLWPFDPRHLEPKVTMSRWRRRRPSERADPRHQFGGQWPSGAPTSTERGTWVRRRIQLEGGRRGGWEEGASVDVRRRSPDSGRANPPTQGR